MPVLAVSLPLISASQDCVAHGPCGTDSFGDEAPGIILNDSGISEILANDTGSPWPSGATIKAAVVAFDTAIATAIAAGYAQNPPHFPLYLQLSGDCYYSSGAPGVITNAVVRQRSYTLLDQNRNPWTGAAATIHETITQTSGSHTIVGGGTWPASAIVDYLTVGGIPGNDQSPVGAIQQFKATTSSSSYPLIVWDNRSTVQGMFGTLGIYYTFSKVSIDGDQMAGVGVCGN